MRRPDPICYFAIIIALLIGLAPVPLAASVTTFDTFPPTEHCPPPPVLGAGPSGMIDISAGQSDPVGAGNWTTASDGLTPTITPYRARANMTNSDDINHRKHFGTDYFGDDFEHNLTFGIDSGDNYGLMAFWMLADDIDDVKGLWDADKPTLTAYAIVNETLDLLSFNLRYEQDGGVGVDSATTGYVAWDYIYRALWPTVTRDDDAGDHSNGLITLDIYGDPARTKLLWTLSVSADAKEDYDILYLLNSYDEVSADTISGFSGELFIDETPPPLFAESNRAAPFNPDDCDNFEDGSFSGDNFCGNESWTATENGAATVAVVGGAEVIGTYSVKVDAEDGANDARILHPTATVEFNGGMANMTFKLDAAGWAAGKFSQVGGLTHSANVDAMLFEVYNAGPDATTGPFYPRIALYDNGNTAWKLGTNTDVAISLDTIYEATLVYTSNTAIGTLAIDNVIVDSALLIDITSFNRGLIGFFGGPVGNDHKYGIRYVGDFYWTNGTTFFPSISRGGTDDGTIVIINRLNDTHAGDYGSEIDLFYSVDNGETITHFYNFDGNATIDLRKAFITWDAAGDSGNGSWWIAQYYHDSGNATFPRTKIYEMTSFDPSASPSDITPVLTERYDSWDDDAKRTLITLTRIIEGDDIIIGLHYFYTGDEAGTNVVKSGRFSTGNYTVFGEETIAEYGDVAAHPLVAEPQQWDTSTGRSTTVRADTDPCCSNQIRRSDYSGGSWGNLTDPGPDWPGRTAWPRAFPFGGTVYWIARDGQPTTQALWGTGIIRSTLDTMQFTGEQHWPGYGETGNGDIDATYAGGGNLSLNVVFDTGYAIFSRMATDSTVQSVTTVAADPVGSITATLKGTIDSLGDSGDLTRKGWVYEVAVNGAPAVPDENTAPDEAANWDSSIIANGTFGVGLHSLVASSLEPNAKYHFAVGFYSVEFEIWVYGEVLSFETTSGILPNFMFIGPF